MPLLYILLGCAAILYGLEYLCGVPGLTRWGMVVVLALLGAFDVLTVQNLLAYSLVWLVPGLLLTEWTRTV